MESLLLGMLSYFPFVFADDSILFYKASKMEAKFLMESFKEYQLSSGCTKDKSRQVEMVFTF